MGPLLIKWKSVEALVCDPDVLSSAKLVGIRLYQFQNANSGACFPSVRRLAIDLGLSTRTIRKLLRHLEAKGWLRTEVSKGPRGSNFYNLPYLGRKFGTAGSEVLVPKQRNSASGKIGKENEKEKRQQKGGFASNKCVTGGRNAGSKSFAKKRGELEAAVAAIYGGEEGWNYVVGIQGLALDAATMRLFAGDTMEQVIAVLVSGR